MEDKETEKDVIEISGRSASRIPFSPDFSDARELSPVHALLCDHSIMSSERAG